MTHKRNCSAVTGLPNLCTCGAAVREALAFARSLAVEPAIGEADRPRDGPAPTPFVEVTSCILARNRPSLPWAPYRRTCANWPTAIARNVSAASLVVAVSLAPDLAACVDRSYADTTVARTREAAPQEARAMTNVTITIDGQVLTATLNDSTAAKDFAALLPLTLTLTDYAATEKISDLPRSLSRAGAPAGTQPSAGDIAYYAPWGNLAIFHRDFRYSDGLISLGRIDGGVEMLQRPGPMTAKFDIVADGRGAKPGR